MSWTHQLGEELRDYQAPWARLYATEQRERIVKCELSRRNFRPPPADDHSELANAMRDYLAHHPTPT